MITRQGISSTKSKRWAGNYLCNKSMKLQYSPLMHRFAFHGLGYPWSTAVKKYYKKIPEINNS